MIPDPRSLSRSSLLLTLVAVLLAACVAEQAPPAKAQAPPARRSASAATGALIASQVVMEHYGSCGFVCHCSASSNGLDDVLYMGCGTPISVTACDAQSVVTVPASWPRFRDHCDQKVVVCLAGSSDRCVEATVMDTGPRNWEGNSTLFAALDVAATDGTWAQRNGACRVGEFAGNTGHCCTYGGGETRVDIYHLAPAPPADPMDCRAYPAGQLACDTRPEHGATLFRCGADQRWQPLGCEDGGHAGYRCLADSGRGAACCDEISGACYLPGGGEAWYLPGREPPAAAGCNGGRVAVGSYVCPATADGSLYRCGDDGAWIALACNGGGHADYACAVDSGRGPACCNEAVGICRRPDDEDCWLLEP